MHLGAFEAAAKYCHLGRAAQELGVTQGAISQQVRSLEEFLCATLFQRLQLPIVCWYQ
jgi:LysR family glycine cleavage system transcriptional activator